MNRKIPAEAFTFYFSLGPGRSYEKVAQQYSVSKRAITAVAAKENWHARIVELERKARDKTDEMALETLEAMNSRHLKVLRYIQNKAIETLKSLPLQSAMDAVRAYDRACERERLVRGEPTERTAINVEEIIRREYANWTAPVDGDEWADPVSGSDAGDEVDRDCGKGVGDAAA